MSGLSTIFRVPKYQMNSEKTCIIFVGNFFSSNSFMNEVEVKKTASKNRKIKPIRNYLYN